MKRRDALNQLWKGSVALGAIRLESFSMTESSGGKEAPVIEWNAHIFSPDLKKFPFHEKGRYRPDVSEQPRDPLAAYLEHMDQEGIERAVLVHPEPYGDDHRLILDCLERERERLRGTSLFYPRDPTAPAKLQALVDREPHIVATRFHALHGNEMYLDSFADQGVRALWKKAFELDLVIELHIGPDYARQVGEAIRAFPGCKVLIDHLAEPHLGTAVDYVHVLQLADIPNVYMKLSGLNHFASDPPLYLSAVPFVHQVASAFGPERMVWGSGTPAIVDAHLDHFDPDARALVKGGNIQHLISWA